MEHHTHHTHKPASGNGLLWGVAVTISFALIEAIAGWWSASLALLGDAGHMLTDSTALGLAAFAVWIARQPPSARHSYGLVRAEIVAALVNGLLMLAIVAGIAYYAIERLQNPQPVMAEAVILVAAIGLIVNIVVAVILQRSEKTLNTRAALLHVMGDLLGSVAALIAGIVIYLTGWMPIDPILSLVICALILYSSAGLLRDAFNVIMEGVPGHLNLPEIGRAMAGVAEVKSVHDLHIWTLSSGLVALSAHIVISDMARWEGILDTLRRLLHDRYDIDHVTIQPEPAIPSVRPIVFKEEGTTHVT